MVKFSNNGLRQTGQATTRINVDRLLGRHMALSGRSECKDWHSSEVIYFNRSFYTKIWLWQMTTYCTFQRPICIYEYNIYIYISILYSITTDVRHYNTVQCNKILETARQQHKGTRGTHKIYPIADLWKRAMGCLLWVFRRKFSVL